MQLKNSIISLLKLVAEKSATIFDDLPDCVRVLKQYRFRGVCKDL